ncbi:carbamoyl-phosphate synthase small subunit [Candidatus Kinetoplastibacterium blastocrithidii TCC012E]|uniref:Carbamoyl phosphate synthase small chain n=1 Tax=Candidatus Kinetoplastidibacterium blastocrithidiae TCC012E TaxID=1208922 RepID=M1LAT4_9PROT|nr:glutamine-hydrolyzing carbamoyl-phosphate synthase small subunit [Candidatus Kinetoplastibacterium blastocrithidii]AFZ83492.1 carbamoyl-phosphate synthase small chain [Candidatus Kinetoplastibacterium blastocrithidii (ex Strigomonas culicis)]AGF49588.1 carbamoyl-phosphate synthase small subunit [Candidatus Kinetoplastibacterium blastocrithidii TCC012E]
MLSQIFQNTKKLSPAVLALSCGQVFKGRSIGAQGYAVAEIVFNTSMTGYQEIMTDASYSGQIVTLTYPHIGNTGVNDEDIESNHVSVSGLVIRNCTDRMSNFRAIQSLPEYLIKNGIVAISDIDTRRLTRIIRENGSQGACILVGEDEDRALELARGFSGMSGKDLAKDISTDISLAWNEGSWILGEGFSKGSASKFHVVAYDFGIKTNILRLLVDRGCRVTIVPAKTSAIDVMKLNPDGVFLSNGPGDPEPCTYAVDAAKFFMEKKIPLFGICLGHQIMGLAVGAKTIKMKTGHHGANHPVQDLQSKRVFITSQNHGFAVDPTTLPNNAYVTHISLFDGSLQGFAMLDRPAFCFQGHPEASPGPVDIAILFDKFISLMGAGK